MTTPSAKPDSSPVAAASPSASAAATGRTPEASASGARPRPKRLPITPILWTLSLLIAYALSPLPVGVALDLLPFKYAQPAHKTFRTVYAPLIWVSDRVPRVHAFYEWYEDLLDV